MDEEAAQVVKHIFNLCMEGRGLMQIAKALREERILTPTAYKHRQGRRTPNQANADPYYWNTNTVVHILERRGVHRLYRQLQDIQQLHLGQETAGDAS